MPVLEYERKCKYIDEYGISNIDASTLTKDKKSYLTILKVLLVMVLILRKLLM